MNKLGRGPQGDAIYQISIQFNSIFIVVFIGHRPLYKYILQNQNTLLMRRDSINIMVYDIIVMLWLDCQLMTFHIKIHNIWALPNFDFSCKGIVL